MGIESVRMRPFKYLEQNELLDILAYVTARYTKMFANEAGKTDFLACRELLVLLQLEIQARQNAATQRGNNINNSDLQFNTSL